jgi:hypothetical protein
MVIPHYHSFNPIRGIDYLELFSMICCSNEGDGLAPKKVPFKVRKSGGKEMRACKSLEPSVLVCFAAFLVLVKAFTFVC